MNIWPFSKIKALEAELVNAQQRGDTNRLRAIHEHRRFIESMEDLRTTQEYVRVSEESHMDTIAQLNVAHTDAAAANERAFRASEAHVVTMGHFNMALDHLAKIVKSPLAGDDGTAFREAIKNAWGFYNAHRGTKVCIMCGSTMIPMHSEDKKLCSNGACGHEVEWKLEDGQKYMYKQNVEPFVEDRSGVQEQLPPLERL